MTEAELQAEVIKAVHQFGLMVYHTHDSRRSQPGFPDLVIVGSSVEFWELKSETGKASPEQREWIFALKQAGNYAGLFRPSDWDVMLGRLARLRA
jgi:hypothetical protein